MTEGEITIRLAASSDQDALSAIRQSVGWEADSVPGQLDAQQAGQRSILLAEVEGSGGWPEPVGTTTVEWQCADRWFADGRLTAHHNDLAVVPAWRHLGVATKLMDAAERMAAAHGKRYFVCQVPAENAPLVALYRRRGNRYGGTGNGFVRLWLDLEEGADGAREPVTHFVPAYDCERPGACVAAARRLVDLHEHYGVPATFFLVGELAEREAEWKHLLASPLFEVASHTYSHRLLRDAPNGDPAVDDAVRQQEIEWGKAAIEDTFGRDCQGFRPPNGYPDGLRGDFDLLTTILEAGYRYASSQLWGDNHEVAPLRAPWAYPVATTSAPGGRWLWELPAHGPHCTTLRETHETADRAGGLNGTGIWTPMAAVYVHLLLDATRAGPPQPSIVPPLPYISFVWHPWNLAEIDPQMGMVDDVLGFARSMSVRCATFAEEWDRLERGGRGKRGKQ